MRKVTRAALVLAGSAALIGVTTVPSFAADSPVTVSVVAGSLSISAPTTSTALVKGSADANLDATATVNLAATKVTDMRAGTATWTATVTLPALTGTTVTTETIPTTDATYLAAAATVVGTATVTAPSTVTGLSTAKTSQITTVVDGNNSASWTADLTVNVPSETLVEEYTGTVTQSVS